MLGHSEGKSIGGMEGRRKFGNGFCSGCNGGNGGNAGKEQGRFYKTYAKNPVSCEKSCIDA